SKPSICVNNFKILKNNRNSVGYTYTAQHLVTRTRNVYSYTEKRPVVLQGASGLIVTRADGSLPQ
ncbi:hypothetical protein SK128_006218, partial [Halocaridina rubra]